MSDNAKTFKAASKEVCGILRAREVLLFDHSLHVAVSLTDVQDKEDPFNKVEAGLLGGPRLSLKQQDHMEFQCRTSPLGGGVLGTYGSVCQKVFEEVSWK